VTWIPVADDTKGYRQWFVIDDSTNDPWNESVDGPFDCEHDAVIEANKKNWKGPQTGRMSCK
jgi:hypothetical protein